MGVFPFDPIHLLKKAYCSFYINKYLQPPLKIPCLNSGVKIEKSSLTKAHLSGGKAQSLSSHIHSTKTAPHSRVEGDERPMHAGIKITFVEH